MHIPIYFYVVLHDLMQSAMAKAIFVLPLVPIVANCILSPSLKYFRIGMALMCVGLTSLLVDPLSRASLPDKTMEEFDPVTIAINLMRSVGGKYNKQHEETIFL